MTAPSLNLNHLSLPHLWDLIFACEQRAHALEIQTFCRRWYPTANSAYVKLGGFEDECYVSAVHAAENGIILAAPTASEYENEVDSLSTPIHRTGFDVDLLNLPSVDLPLPPSDDPGGVV